MPSTSTSRVKLLRGRQKYSCTKWPVTAQRDTGGKYHKQCCFSNVDIKESTIRRNLNIDVLHGRAAGTNPMLSKKLPKCSKDHVEEQEGCKENIM